MRHILILAALVCSQALAQSSNGTRLPTPVVILPLANHSATGQLIFEDTGATPGTITLQAPSTVNSPYRLVLPASMSAGCLGFTPNGSIWAGSSATCGPPAFPANTALTANYTALAADFSTCATIPVSSGSITITMVASASQPANGQCLWIVNYGSGTVTLAPSGQSLNGSGGNIALGTGSASAPSGAFVVSDGTNYDVQVLGGNSGVVRTLYSGQQTGLAGSSGSSSFAMGTATPAAGLYRANFYGTQTASSSGCSTLPVLDVSVGVHDGIGTYNVVAVVPGSSTSGFTMAPSSPLAILFTPVVMRLNGSYIPTYQSIISVAGVGCSSFGTFTLSAALEYIGQ
jgi:hypothetical protein